MNWFHRRIRAVQLFVRDRLPADEEHWRMVMKMHCDNFWMQQKLDETERLARQLRNERNRLRQDLEKYRRKAIRNKSKRVIRRMSVTPYEHFRAKANVFKRHMDQVADLPHVRNAYRHALESSLSIRFCYPLPGEPTSAEIAFAAVAKALNQKGKT